MLSKIDIQAMKQANTICFDYFTNSKNEIVSQIRCIKETKPYQQIHLINVKSNFIISNGELFSSRKSDNVKSCFTSIYFCSSRNFEPDHFFTFLQFLKVNDELTLLWSADYYGMNGYIKTAKSFSDVSYNKDLHVDELRINIKRKEKKYQFYIDSTICPNNSARFIKFNDTY